MIKYVCFKQKNNTTKTCLELWANLYNSKGKQLSCVKLGIQTQVEKLSLILSQLQENFSYKSPFHHLRVPPTCLLPTSVPPTCLPPTGVTLLSHLLVPSHQNPFTSLPPTSVPPTRHPSTSPSHLSPSCQSPIYYSPICLPHTNLPPNSHPYILISLMLI